MELQGNRTDSPYPQPEKKRWVDFRGILQGLINYDAERSLRIEVYGQY